MMASVFGVPEDHLVGEETASGHVLAAYDRLVALPSCTESSCPWLPLGTTGHEKWGNQTTCSEADGLCWVEITSIDTGGCTVAPVLDVGPLFRKDNWWAARADRIFDLPRGVPAAEAARDGKNFGYGAGISDAGYDVKDVFDYAAAVDLAAGTWVDLGLDPDQGIGEVEVRLLWQTALTHEEACGRYGNARTTDFVNMRAGPSTSDDVLTVLDEGDRLGIIGGQRNGFYPVVHGGMTGWVFAEYAAPDGTDRSGAEVGIVTEQLRFREGPSTADPVIERMPAGSLVLLTGEEENGFLSIRFDGVDGWAYAEFLETGDEFSEGGGTVGAGTSTRAVTTDDVNLRVGPGLDNSIKLVVPAGATVTVTGSERNNFIPVDYKGTKGWLYSDYVNTGGTSTGSNTRTVTEPLNLRSGASLSDDVILVMPAGATVTLRGSEKNGFAPITYNGHVGWAYSSYLS
jgi:uncharacterized protein YraI